jgi:hypothetical protein
VLDGFSLQGAKTYFRRLAPMPLDPDSVYHNIVRKYGRETGVDAQVSEWSFRAFAACDGRHERSR